MYICRYKKDNWYKALEISKKYYLWRLFMYVVPNIGKFFIHYVLVIYGC